MLNNKEKRKNGRPAKNKKTRSGSLLFQCSIYAYPLALFAIFWIGTNFNSLIMAFQNIAIDGTRTFAGFTHFVDFFNGIFGVNGNNALLTTSFVNSIKMFLINLAICMPLYLVFSLYLFKKLPGNRAFLIIVMIPSIVSDFVIAIVFKQIVNTVLPNLFGKFGIDFPELLVDSRYTFGTMLFFMIWLSFSTSLIIYPNAMRAIPDEVLESAQVDGAGMWKEFFYIIFPLIFPTISSFLIMGIAGIFINAGPAVAFFKYGAYSETYTVGYYYIAQVMNAVNETGYPELAAGGIILTIISCPLTFGAKYLFEKISYEEN